MPELFATYEEEQNEFERDRIIDKYNLDIEWEEQQRLYKKWSDFWCEAEAEAEKAEEYVKFMEAKLDNDFRETWEEVFPTKRMTEAGVRAAVKNHPEYRQAVYDHIEAKRRANILQGGKVSFDGRKFALQNLTTLHASNYFSRPSISKELKEGVVTETTQQRAARTNEALGHNVRLQNRRRKLTTN